MNIRSLLIEGFGMGTALLLVTALAPQTILASAVALFCLFYSTHRLAPSIFPAHSRAPRLFLTCVTLLGIQSILQTLLYYIGASLGVWIDALTQLVSIAMAMMVTALAKPLVLETAHFEEESATSFFRALINDKKLLFLKLAVVLSGTGSALFIIWHAHALATTEAIRTPWAVLPPGTLLAFVCLFAASWLMAWQSQSLFLTWVFAALFFILITLLTPILYPLGFGFDGFLHRASEAILFQTGTLTPKPFYYIGHYTLVTWLARTLLLTTQTIDTFLLAGLVALLPASLALQNASEKKKELIGAKTASSLIALLLLLPLKPWITTTPQSSAYLIGLSALLLATLPLKGIPSWPAFILATWSVAIHPLAGLPLFGGTLIALVRPRLSRFPHIRTFFSICLPLGTAAIVPLAFFLHSQLSGAQTEWNISTLFSLTHMQAFVLNLFTIPALRIALWPDWAAFIEYLFPFAVFLFMVVGIWKSKDTAEESKEHRQTLLWTSITGLFVMLAAWWMQNAVTFTFLITYERQDYIQRLFFIGQLLLMPAAIFGLVRVWERVKAQPAITFYGFILCMLAWQGARLYRAFPYHDATHIEHGWNTSQAAFEAVRWIEHDSHNQPYTVLADQAVSAGAVAELGFKRYADDVFFYPIPTGGALYQVFLRAATVQATLQDIEEAAHLGKSELVYVVIADYWWQSDQVAEHLAKLAQNSYSIRQDTVRIYRFTVNKDKKR